MATAAVTLPRPRRRSRTQPAAGRARVTDFYFVKHIDNSRLCREVDREKRRECFCLLGLGVLVFLFGLVIAWQHFQCVRYGYQIEGFKAQRAAMEEWNHQLRLEQASLADPQRIDTLARKKLGLAPPNPEQVIRMDGARRGGEVVGTPEFARNYSVLGEEIPRGH
ncbi:MAG: cell division protein FtsL [Acidobacteria bacterium]|nr:cell division protein FtsL [Acidobacteriota bacterium]